LWWVMKARNRSVSCIRGDAIERLKATFDREGMPLPGARPEEPAAPAPPTGRQEERPARLAVRRQRDA